jgi:TM2 domain-containing membrane protein YozV
MNQANYSYSVITSDKSKKTTLLLCIFLGFFGAHCFYAGRFGRGILMFMTAGLFGIGWLVDIMTISGGYFRDGNGAPIKISIFEFKEEKEHKPRSFRDLLRIENEVEDTPEKKKENQKENVLIALFIIAFIGVLFFVIVVLPDLFSK